jgi:hypothetical protein
MNKLSTEELIKVINSKIAELKRKNDEFSSFEDELVRVPGVLEAHHVREMLEEETLEYKERLTSAIYRSTNVRKKVALEAVNECLESINGEFVTSAIDIEDLESINNCITKTIDVADRSLDYVKKQHHLLYNNANRTIKA